MRRNVIGIVRAFHPRAAAVIAVALWTGGPVSPGAGEIFSWETDVIHRVDHEPIDRVCFEAAAGTLRVYFTDGAVYEFYDVPRRWFETFMRSSAKLELFYRDLLEGYSFTCVGRPHRCG